MSENLLPQELPDDTGKTEKTESCLNSNVIIMRCINRGHFPYVYVRDPESSLEEDHLNLMQLCQNNSKFDTIDQKTELIFIDSSGYRYRIPYNWIAFYDCPLCNLIQDLIYTSTGESLNNVNEDLISN